MPRTRLRAAAAVLRQVLQRSGGATKPYRGDAAMTYIVPPSRFGVSGVPAQSVNPHERRGR